MGHYLALIDKRVILSNRSCYKKKILNLKELLLSEYSFCVSRENICIIMCKLINYYIKIRTIDCQVIKGILKVRNYLLFIQRLFF